MSATTYIDNDRLEEVVEEALTDTQDTITRAIITAIKSNATEREPSLREVRDAIENNSWDLDDLGIDADDVVKNMSTESVVGLVSTTDLIDGCIDKDGVDDVLTEVILHSSVTAERLVAALADTHVEFRQSVLAELKKLNAGPYAQPETPAVDVEKLRAEIRAEVEREVQAKLVACLFGRPAQEGV